MPKSDAEIVAELSKHSTVELLEFQKKLKKMPDNPQAWAIRFHITGVLTNRYLFEEFSEHS